MNLTKTLPFDEVNKHALAAYPPLLQEWCPGGKVVGGKEYVALNPTRSDTKPGSFSINIHTGKWKDFATGDEGGDPISLYAYLECGGTGKLQRVEACKQLAAIFGLSDDQPLPRKKSRPHLKVVPKPEAEPDDWQPMVPPPDDVPGPNVTGYDHVFVYRDRDGRLLRYVVRNDAKGGRDKWVRPLTYGLLKGKPGWELRGPNDPKSLYGLERLDGRPALLQEGEKKTDQVQALLPDYACLSLTGGAGAIDHNDLSPLAGLAVLYAPDNDEPGRKAARLIIDKLLALGATVLLLDVSSHGFPEKWDLGNAVEEGWDADQIRAFILENAKPYVPDAAADFEQPDDDSDAEWKEGGQPDPATLPPIPLGYDNGMYFYLSPLTKQIEVLTRRQHKKDDLIGIAGLRWFESVEQFQNDKGETNWTQIKDYLQNLCHTVGFYNPDRVRRRGAYLDEGRAVLNLGDRLLVNSESLPLILPGSRFIYEGARSLNHNIVDPIGPDRAVELLEICKLFPWEKPISATLMAGWLVVAPICGALFWRPSIWITGGSGSGKSTLEKLVMKPALGNLALFLKGGTTEAGVRQKLGRDALAVFIDEAESESPKAKGIMQGLLDLNRQSSSEDGAEIIKGTQSQAGAKTYSIKSCFAFSSINPMLDHLADESRVTVLELKNPRTQIPEAFDAMVARITGAMTSEFCAGLLSRHVALMPNILKNAATFSRAVSVHLGSSRVGDQIGTMLAGAYSLQKNGEVSFDTALAWVKGQDWEDTTSADADPDERRMLNHLMQQRVRLDLGGGKFQDLTMAELVLIAAKDHADISGPAQAELKRHGLWYENGGVWIANDHTALKKHLDGTPWSSKWERTLRRLPGTRARARTEAALRFPGTPRCRATFVPMELIE